ncbi:MAG: hypothetical protein AAGA76_14530 [Pseudomonadota bacterium]
MKYIISHAAVCTAMSFGLLACVPTGQSIPVPQSSPGFAENSSASSETFYVGTRLRSLIHGKSVQLENGAVLKYGSDWKFESSQNNQRLTGTYRLDGDQVCVVVSSGSSRCDSYLEDSSGNLYLVDGDGILFQVRSIE